MNIYATVTSCVISTLLLCSSSYSQADEFVCHWAAGQIAIDGKADDGAWQKAQVIDNFRIPATGGQKPTTTTRARLLWDRQYIYFFADLEDHDLFGDITERDAMTWNNDVFEIFLKPGATEPGYYEFQVNAAGTEMDLFLPDQKSGGYAALKSANTFQMKTAVVRRGTLDNRNDRDEGWSVEGCIPWVDFMPTGGRPDVNEVWSIALCRYDYTLGKEPELSSCAPLSKLNFHLVEDYAKLRFAGAGEGDKAATEFSKRKKFVDSKVLGSPEPPLPYRPKTAFTHLKLNWPIDVQVEPGTRNFIVIDEAGAYGPTVIKRVPLDAGKEQTPATYETLVETQGTAYSIAFHPNFAQNGYMYIGSNGKKEGEPNRSRIVRYTLSRTAPYQVTDEPLTIIEWDSNGHNGAAVTFGNDGMMYVTSGDGTSDSDANDAGQDLSKLLSKVLRIDVDHPTSGKAYAVPKDNPFVGDATVVPETWAYGLRNPWRITCDPKTGHIWVGNNGQDMYEQAYLVERGANYGWSVFEGSYPFYSQRKLGPTPHVKPTVEHAHSESRSLTGGVVYHGTKLPELQGAYIYGDYSTGKIWGVKHDGQQIIWHRELADTAFQISAIVVDHDGELLIVDHRPEGLAGLYHLEANEQSAAPSTFPRKLSDTGLFAAVAGHQVAEGLIPYSVNAPFWSDGAIKSRFVALPKDGRIETADRWAWQFPENTVIVKSFELEMKAGDPTSKRWIETRLLTKQQGEWVGYSYEWLDDQTDAILVEKSGRDRTFAISNKTGDRNQVWHYPSRTECMACHTRAAGFVLGLSTEQLNKAHDYGNGVQLNQIDALERLGVLTTDWLPKAKEALRDELKSNGKSQTEIDAALAAAQPLAGQLKLRSNHLLGTSPESLPKLSDPYDVTQDLEKRARAFLHSNCAYCHVEAGGGNAKMDLSIYANLDQMKIVDVVPTHHTYGKPDAKLIASGDPDRSVLLYRVGTRGPGQMPQLSTSVVDAAALDMLTKWVKTLARQE
ncbi:MAG: PQQ-dependent sugar dehydrogenase [Pirellulaceae bacterium]|nr:PQQ-dependent sugar dehydrogenase [Pirellulaceae bacterium]